MSAANRKYKATKLRSIIFFLLLALVFWALTKFSKESTAAIQAKLDFTNIPTSVSISEENLNYLNFDVTANGFQFLSYKLNEPTIQIDVSKYYTEGDSVVVLSNSELNTEVSAQIDKNTRLYNVSIDELAIRLDHIISKKVPVIFNAQLNFKEGFRSTSAATIEPDSVLVSGPSEALGSIMGIHSEAFSQDNVSETIETTVNLVHPEPSDLKIQTREIRVKVPVEEFTQKQVLVPVEVVNVPADVTLKLLPDKVNVRFEVSVSRFNAISANDFQMVCDYAEKTLAESFMIPKLVQQPDGIHHLELDTKKIEYLIFK